MRGHPLEKDPEIERKVDEIIKQRDPRGLKVRFNDDYHVVARMIQRRYFWRNKLLKERDLQLMRRGGQELNMCEEDKEANRN